MYTDNTMGKNMELDRFKHQQKNLTAILLDQKASMVRIYINKKNNWYRPKNICSVIQLRNIMTKNSHANQFTPYLEIMQKTRHTLLN